MSKFKLLKENLKTGCFLKKNWRLEGFPLHDLFVIFLDGNFIHQSNTTLLKRFLWESSHFFIRDLSHSLSIVLSVPETKMVLWNGKCYFLPLANLWANLINCDPPELPYLDVGSWENHGENGLKIFYQFAPRVAINPFVWQRLRPLGHQLPPSSNCSTEYTFGIYGLLKSKVNLYSFVWSAEGFLSIIFFLFRISFLYKL